ncbi:MAG: hypothetical protein WCT32_04170 [Patescibacteria group bacterium]|jgi:hypothetical protein
MAEISVDRRAASEVGRERKEALGRQVEGAKEIVGQQYEQAKGWLSNRFSGAARKVGKGLRFLGGLTVDAGGKAIDGVLGADQAAKNLAAETVALGKEIGLDLKEQAVEDVKLVKETTVAVAQEAGRTLVDGYNRAVEVKDDAVDWGTERFNRACDTGREVRTGLIRRFNDGAIGKKIHEMLEQITKEETKLASDTKMLEVMQQRVALREQAIATMRGQLSSMEAMKQV